MLHPQLTARLWHVLPRLVLVLLLAAAFLSLTLPILAAHPGDLDPTFGNGGIVAPTFLGAFLSNAITIQPDGKIVTAGQDPAVGGLFIVLRHNPDGSLDSSFGSGGVVTSSFNSTSAGYGPVGMALQPDGKIIVVGVKVISTSFSHTFAVVRYNNDGTLDNSFGSNGIVATPIRNSGAAWNVAIQPDHKIVVVGDSFGDEGKYTLARYLGADPPIRSYLPVILKP